MTQEFKEELDKYGLKINFNKTEYMYINRKKIKY